MGANAQIEVPAFTAGQVLTAAEMTQINTGIPVFATTVTRDAAFGGAGEKVLAEGQFAYIEATDITQYYNGSAWVTLGAIAPTSAFTAGQQDTNSTSYVALTTATAVTVTTGTSALVVAQATLLSATASAASFMSFAISGATTVAASDNYAAFVAQASTTINTAFYSTLYYVVTGLTAGSNTFSLQYKTSAGFTYVNTRRITVFPL
jgi:hypothetical protein